MEDTKHVLIIGGGFAGLSCAKKLANRPGVRVTLIDKENHHLFQPLLYQVATAALSAPDIARSLRQLMSRAANVTVLMDTITGIDTEKSQVSSPIRTYDYDYLVVAAGAQTSYFGKDEWAAHTLGLKSLDDAFKVRRCVFGALERAELTDDPEERKRLMTIAIVGGGPTGVELAGAYSDLARRALKTNFRRLDINSLRVILIQSGDRILKPFDPDQSKYTQERLEHLGVEIVLGHRVTGVERHTLTFDEREPIHAETLIWAAGVGASPLTRMLGVDTDRGGRVKTNPDLTAPGMSNVYLAGDVTAHTDAKGQQVPGLAPAATQMGEYIGDRIVDLTSAPGEHPSAPFIFKDKGIMAIIGKNAAVVKMGSMKLRGYLAWMTWLFIHLLFLIGFRSKLSVLLQWAWAYVKDKPGARVFTAKQ
ncbi:NAD(P)/FAD-dependent oxidoreductase [Verrucomicrobiaceae bacterium R5-34]|uniref:NADH:ubiquinone reductase (non-electrogenic) n=1 Tax=Oceaniferula flava TaxID=2800421 RepID=A0AAE2SFY4_9BACT|nr:NAD(P)/FAD-dependent oxidoreductase [Oceaniferula flavus]MBK1832150.1 NAD(P)/FAD-dependent oxidoreductase [Verrucomicrobiaceae bacterium R5-34]MBK1856262.1 NAD(P)/FAD-dependent oxidoreductase [Oceaniferula flavus]MBM1137569.1 NAD(P)/FAD-dependent oxidoreductase [Oceaniferula flavus]